MRLLFRDAPECDDRLDRGVYRSRVRAKGGWRIFFAVDRQGELVAEPITTSRVTSEAAAVRLLAAALQRADPDPALRVVVTEPTPARLPAHVLLASWRGLRPQSPRVKAS